MIGFRNDTVRHIAILAGTGAIAACPAEDPPAVAGSSSGETTEATPTTADSTSPDPSATGPLDESTGGGCGNGQVDPGEECDGTPGCTAECTLDGCAMVWSWSETIPSGSPGANATTLDAAHNVYSVGTKPETDNDIWVAKWDSEGNQLWSRIIASGNGVDVGRGLAVDDGGDVYIAGRIAGDGDAMYYARLAGADGSEVWSQTIDSMFPDGDDIGVDVAIAPDGDIVVAGRLRVGDGDDDAWLSRRSAADGSEIWATTWSGPGDGTFSTDRVGGLDIAPDGTIWLAVREHVAFNEQEAVLLAFDAAGNNTVTAAPQRNVGPPHGHDPLAVVAYDGGAYFAFVHDTSPYRAWLYKIDDAGDEVWSMIQTDWLGDIGEEYVLRAVDVDDEGTLHLGGYYTVTGGPSGHEWSEAWVAQLDPEGAYLCRGNHMEDDGAPFAPVLTIFSGGSGPGGGMALSGRVDEGAGTESWLWTGYFAP